MAITTRAVGNAKAFFRVENREAVAWAIRDALEAFGAEPEEGERVYSMEKVMLQAKLRQEGQLTSGELALKAEKEKSAKAKGEGFPQ
jgi:hypothetical protein